MGISADAIWGLAELLNREIDTRDDVSNAMVSRIDVDGKAWVRLDGSSMDTPVNGGTRVTIAQNDAVLVSIKNGVCTITNNRTHPNATSSDISTVNVSVNQLDEKTMQNFAAVNGVIENLEVDTAKIHSLSGDQLAFTVGVFDNLTAEEFDANKMSALVGFFTTLTVEKEVTAEKISATTGFYDNLTAKEVNADKISSGIGFYDELTAKNLNANNISAGVGFYDQLTAKEIDVDVIEAVTEYVGDLNANNVTTNDIKAATGYIDDLTTKNITTENISAATAFVGDLNANKVTAEDIEAATGYIGQLTTDKVTAGDIQAATAFIGDLDAENVTAADIAANKATIAELDSNYAHITHLDANTAVIDNATIDQAKVNNLSTNYAAINLANVNNAWVKNGVIDTAAIVDEQVFTVTGNKATLSEINADNITVRNLNAKNLKIETADGYVTIGDKKTPTKEFIDSLVDDIQDKIDSTVETFTSSAVPLTSNYPANQWTTDDERLTHVGDICFVTNSASQQNGFCYRYAYDSTNQSFSWVLIKDNDVTKALGDISTLQTFKSDTESWIEETDSGLRTIRENHTTLSGIVDKTVKASTQLWFTKANTTAPSAPTAQVTTNNASTANKWNLAVPSYNASYPNYFYCWQYQYADNTYGWSAVIRDVAMGESQERARTAITNAAAADTKAGNAQTAADGAQTTANTANTNAAAAQSTANANIKSSVQLWYTSNSTTPPAKPTARVTATSTTANAWTNVVPTYSASTPNYHYCYQQQLGNGNWQWTDPTYDSATSVAMEKAQKALPSSTFSTFQTTTFKELVDEVDEQSSTITSMSEAVQYGGRNLLPYSSPSAENLAKTSTASNTNAFVTEDGYGCYKITGSSTNGSQYASGGGHYNGVILDANTTYTYSATIKVTTTGSATTVPLNFYSLGHFSVINENSSQSDKTHEDVAGKRAFAPDAVNIGEWTRISVTFTTNSLDKSAFGVYPKHNLGANYTVFIRDMKLERGPIATPWEYSQSDVTTVSNTVNTVKQTADSNVAKLTNLTTTLGTNADGTTSTTDIVHRTSAVEQNLEGITTRVGVVEARKSVRLTIRRDRWTSTQWAQYGAIGHKESFNNKHVYSSGDAQTGFDSSTLAIGDIVMVTGVDTDKSATHTITAKVTAVPSSETAGIPLEVIYSDDTTGLSDRVTTAETTIQQNSESIALKASVTDVYQNLKPNLAPLFSSSPYFPAQNDYWVSRENNTQGLFNFTYMGEGWVRVQCDLSSSTSYKRCNMVSRKSPGVEPDTDYTFLFEFRNNHSVLAAESTESRVYVVQTNNCQFWGGGIKKNIEMYGRSNNDSSSYIESIPSDGTIVTHRFVKTSETLGSSHWTDGDIAKVVGCVSIVPYIIAGDKVDFEMRVSIYEGEYTGPYKPYSGTQLYSTQAALEVKANKDTLTSEINASADTVTINADRVNIAGATIFTEGRLSESSLNGAYDAKGSAASVQSKLDNLRVGGTNLLPRSKVSTANLNSTSAFSNVGIVTEDGYECYKSTGNATSVLMWPNGVELASNTTYTYSACIKVTTTTAASQTEFGFNRFGHFQVYNDSSTNSDKSHEDVVNSRVYTPSTLNVNKWTKITITFTTNSLDKSRFIVFPKYNTGTDWTLFIKDMKLEQGNVATDWSPAPSDIDASANNREQTIYRSAADGTSSIAANTTWVTASGDTQNAWTTRRPTYDKSYPVLFVAYQRQTVAQSAGTTCSCTTPTIDNTTTVIDGGRIITGSVTANKLNAQDINASNMLTIGSFTSDTSESVLNSNVHVGGRNLLKNSGTPLRIPTSGTATVQYAFWGLVIYGLPFSQNEVFTLSGSVTINSGTYTSITAAFYDSAHQTSYHVGKTIPIVDGRITWTFTVSADLAGQTDVQLLLYAGVSGSTQGNAVTYTNLKLERGNKATDWTPAPEDVSANAVKRTQRIYYRSNVNTKPTAMPSTWVTETGNKYNSNATTVAGWSTKVTPITSSVESTTKYLYLWTCEQRQMMDGTIAYTSVLLDDSTTVIDGGNIVTGSVTANKLNATNINSSGLLTVGALTDSAQNSILNSNVQDNNLFLGATLADRSTFVPNGNTDYSKPLRYYNGNASIHNFTEWSSGVYQDTVTLISSGNLGIAFCRRADEMGLDPTSKYVVTCWAKCSKAGMYLAFGRSYFKVGAQPVWRGNEQPIAFDAADTWQKFTWVIDVDADTEAICYCFTVNSGTGTETFTIRNCRMEKADGMPVKVITTVSDLNDYKTTGIYYFRVGSNTNAPVTNQGKLTVNFDQGTPNQIFEPDNLNYYYKRTYSSSTWSAWTKVDAVGAQTTADAANNKLVAFRGTCSTAAGTAAKVVTCEGFALSQGYSITVYNTTAQTVAGAITLNVNSLGAKAVWVAGAATSDTNRLYWSAGSSVTFVYDGTQFRVSDNPGSYYGTTCSVAETVAAKTTTVNDSVIFKGVAVSVPMTNTNTAASPTLNVSALGACNIYYGTSTTGPTKANGFAWPAGTEIIFIFDGKFWRCGNQTFVNGGNILTGTVTADQLSSNSVTTGKVASNAITTDKLTVKDSTNYCQLNEATAEQYGWDVEQDSSAPNTPWFVKNTISRDNHPSQWFDCVGGEQFLVGMEVSSTVKGATTNGGSDSAYMGIKFGVQCQAANATSSWPTVSIATSSSAGTAAYATGVVTIPDNMVRFRAFVLVSGYPPFTGTLKIRRCTITKMANGKLIVDGSVSANKLDVNDINAKNLLTIGALSTSTQNSILNSNVQVGGRNLLAWSDRKGATGTSSAGLSFTYNADGWITVTGTINSSSAGILYFWGIDPSNYIYPAGTYTITVENDGLLAANVLRVQFGYDNTYGYLYDSGSMTFIAENGISRVCLFRYGANGTSVNGRIRFKMEKGNKATDWTPAPEEVSADSVKRTQRIYYRSNVNTKPTAMPTAWVTETGNKYNANATTASGWSAKVTPITSSVDSETKYVYLWTCEQREMADGTIAYTNVLLDDSTTVIDGGNIVTGSITANKLDVSDINTKNSLTIGALTNDTQSSVLNSNVVVGGRNLLPYSKPSSDNLALMAPAKINVSFVTEDGYGCYKATGNGTSIRLWYERNFNAPVLSANTTYTYSAWVKVTTTTSTTSIPINFSSLGHFGVSNSASTNSDKTHEDVAAKRVYSPSSIPVGKWSRISLTFETNSLDGSLFGVYPKFNLSTDYTLFIRDMKLELGNKATDWTPAPEDVSADSVKRTQRIYYRSNVNTAPTTPSAWVTETGNKYNTNATTTSGWSTKVTPITSSVDSSTKYIYLWTCEQREMANGTIAYTNVLLDDSMTVIEGGNIATGSITANKLNVSDINASNSLTIGSLATDTQSNILNENVAVGGRNLAKHANFLPQGVTSLPRDGEVWTCSPCGGGNGIKFPSRMFKAGESYVLSFTFQKTSGTLTAIGGHHGGFSCKSFSVDGVLESRTFSQGHIMSNDGNAHKVVVKLRFNGGSNDDNLYIQPNRGAYNGNSSSAFKISYVKIETGNKATDWTPAPEDIEASISTAQSTANSANSAASAAQTAAGNAAKTATNYITYANATDGIKVTYNGTNAATQITANGLNVIDGAGNSVLYAGLTETGATTSKVRVGRESGTGKVTLNSDGSVDIYNDSGTNLAHFGFDYTVDTYNDYTKSPFYTIGTRKSDADIGAYSFAEGFETTSGNWCSHAEGYKTVATGSYGGHAEGMETTASGPCAHAEGGGSVASGGGAHAEGSGRATASNSHAEGVGTLASGEWGSHSEGWETDATGWSAHAEGRSTTASGLYTHAEGFYTTASGDYSHAEGQRTIAQGANQHACGKFNVSDTTSLIIVGNGTRDNQRANELTLSSDGNLWIAGTLTQNSDRRLKTHHAYLGKEASTFMRKLRPALFTKDGERHLGFYAQDVQDAEPENWDTVTVKPEHTDESLDFDPLTLDYTALIAPLTAYAQQLEKRVEYLESTVDSLVESNEELREMVETLIGERI